MLCRLQNAEQVASENSLNLLEAQTIIRRLKQENELLDKSNEHLIQQNTQNSSMLRLVTPPLNRTLVRLEAARPHTHTSSCMHACTLVCLLVLIF